MFAEEAAKAEQTTKMQRTVACDDGAHQRIAIDLSFDAIMNDKVRCVSFHQVLIRLTVVGNKTQEVNSLAKQIKLSYGVIKQMATPFQLHLVNCSEPLRQSLQRFGAENWFVRWHLGQEISQAMRAAVSAPKRH